MIKHCDQYFRPITARELRQAMIALGLDPSDKSSFPILARNLMMGATGYRKIERWLSGREPVTGPASTAIRLWLAIRGKAVAPAWDGRNERAGALAEMVADLELAG